MELKETTYLFELYMKKFFEECCPNDVESENTPQGQSIPEHTTEESEQNDLNAILEGDDDKYMKKLYRLLSLKTHPDKVQNNTEEAKQLFLDVQNAYKQKDILRLLSFATQLNIPHKFEDVFELNQPTFNIEHLFEKSIDTIHNNIQNMKCTLAWNWQVADENTKNDLCHRYNLRRL